jgi:hypothetical protein
VWADPCRCRPRRGACGARCGTSAVDVSTVRYIQLEGRCTLNAAQYGTPMGRFANRASVLFARMPLNARLCVISWIARNRLWFAVPPTTYASATSGHQPHPRTAYASPSWSATTPATTNLVRGSWPIRRVTSGCAARIARRRERCGSSVCSQRKSAGSCGGCTCLSVGSTRTRRGGRPSESDSAPPYSE